MLNDYQLNNMKMKRKLLLFLSTITALFISNASFAQRPNLGAAYNFVLFSSDGAATNTGASLLVGNIGNNKMMSTAFGNVNGVMHDTDDVTQQCAADLLIAYNQLAATIPAYFPTPVFGNGDTVTAGVYAINSAANLSGNYTLNGQGDTNALYIFQIQGAFSTDSNSKIKLINGARACNVFWKVEGLVSMGAYTTMKGTIIANNGAIVMTTGDSLEGRALTTTGAITVDGVVARVPFGFGLPRLVGPEYPVLGKASCFAIFSGNGGVTNGGDTYATGDIGTNVGLTVGYNNLFITGDVHDIPDVLTAEATADLGVLYTHLNTLNYDIELLYPAQFGRNLELTPHVYLLNAATTLTDTLFMNAEGNPDAVFVIQINGALSTTVNSKVVLMNGAQAKNIFWKVDGAVSISDYSIFNGTIVANNGAINLKTGVVLNGRALTTTGALSTEAVTVISPTGCEVTGIQIADTEISVNVFPNPFNNNTTFQFNNQGLIQATHLSIYNVFGVEIRSIALNSDVTKVEEVNISSGIYLYKILKGNTVLKSGKLISE
jgi:hypothetical protein